MISDEKEARWCEMISASDSRFDFELGLDPEKGVRWRGEPPYPDLKLRECKEVQVRRFVSQTMVVTASVPEDSDQTELIIDRLVAELEGGRQVELVRTARPAEREEVLDPDVCRACEGKIVDKSETVMHEGEPYHRRCME